MRTLRHLVQTPGTTAVIVLTLALGIGANAAIFSLMNAVMLRALPIPHPEELVSVMTTINDDVNGNEELTLPMVQELFRSQEVFSHMFASQEGGIDNAEAEGHHYITSVATVSGDYYPAMQISPLLGRFLNAGDESNAVAVIKYRAWRTWFHGAPDVVGQTLRLGGHPFTVVGVEPEGFNGLHIDGSSDVTVPLFAPGVYSSRDPKQLWLEARGRLRSGVTLQQARVSLETLWPAIQKATLPSGYDTARTNRFLARKLKVEAAGQGVSSLRRKFSHPLWILLALVGSLLLIACLNLANLSIAKMAAHQHAWSIKLALGAGRWHLLRPILMESFLLSLIGAAGGLAIAYFTGPLLLHVGWTGFVAAPLSLGPDLRVLAFTAGITVLTAILFAVVPAWYATRAEAGAGLRENTRSVHQGSTVLGKSLLIVQVALSLVLVAGAMLFARTLVSLHTVDAGYERDHLLLLQLFPQAGSGKLQNRSAYYRELFEKVKAVPGVALASYSNMGPANEFEYREPTRVSPDRAIVQAIEEEAAPDFFAAMGTRVLAGREFAWSDDEKAPLVAIVSQTFAAKLYGHTNPLGREFYSGLGAAQKKLRIVGVVNNARLWKVESIEPMAVYTPLLQNPDADEPMLDVRTLGDPGVLKNTLERTVRSLGHHYSLRTLTVDERLNGVTTAQRLTALLAIFFGVVAVLIAAIGLYGLMSFYVTQRTTEMGVRLALGAQTWQVFSMILREVMLIALIGCTVGLLASVGLRSYVASILFGVSATDPLWLSLAVLVLVSVGLLAGFLPARRASLVDPAIALRKE